MARKTIFRSIFIIAVFVVFAPNEARAQFVNVYHVNTGGDGVVVGACANPPAECDTTVFRPSSATWYSQRSTAGTLVQQFGANGDRPIPNAFVP